METHLLTEKGEKIQEWAKVLDPQFWTENIDKNLTS
jgi:hypothetical protein